jgi:hypothetical protein
MKGQNMNTAEIEISRKKNIEIAIPRELLNQIVLDYARQHVPELSPGASVVWIAQQDTPIACRVRDSVDC